MIKVEKTAKTLDEGIKSFLMEKVQNQTIKDGLQMHMASNHNGQKIQLAIGIIKQKLNKVKSTLKLYKILVFLFYRKRRL